MAPRVSVVLAVYNGERYLEESVRSILDQRFRDVELIVIDDGSTDGTPEILSRLMRDDQRIVVRRQDNRGLTPSLNRGIALAQGVYVARQDADDISLPTRLEHQVAYLDSQPSVAALGTGADVIDESGAVGGTLNVALGPPAVKRGLMTLRSTPVHGSMIIRKSALELMGGYREAFRVAQDYDLWLRLTSAGEIDNLPEVLYRWRLNHDSVFATRRSAQLKYAGIALAFARERAAEGHDSCELLEGCDGDLDRFAARYQYGPMLHAIWGELLLRGVGNSAIVRWHFRQAVYGGQRRLWVLLLLVWTHLRLPWPGGQPLALGESASTVGA